MKEGECSSSANTESEEHSNSEPPKSSSEEEDNLENESSHFKRMSKLEQCLKALANRGDLQDVGIIRPYPAEWDTVPYFSRFEVHEEIHDCLDHVQVMKT